LDALVLSGRGDFHPSQLHGGSRDGGGEGDLLKHLLVAQRSNDDKAVTEARPAEMEEMEEAAPESSAAADDDDATSNSDDDRARPGSSTPFHKRNEASP
jgi:hypothetical protein